MIVPKEGRLALARRLFNDTVIAISDQLTLTLYKNDITPTIDSTAADFDPSTFTGGDALQTHFDKFAEATLDGAFAVSRLWADGTHDYFRWFVTAAPHTVYGWYLTHDDSGTLIGAERFAPIISPVVGTVITLFLDFELGKFVAD